VLRACRKVLRPGGRIAYFTIFITPGVTKRQHRKAVRLGPRAVGAKMDQRELLAASGFVQISVKDVTGEFLQTARAWYQNARELEPDLRATIGDELFDEQQGDRQSLIAGVEEGLLSRALVIASKPR
jgi:hypothetical protein